MTHSWIVLSTFAATLCCLLRCCGYVLCTVLLNFSLALNADTYNGHPLFLPLTTEDGLTSFDVKQQRRIS